MSSRKWPRPSRRTLLSGAGVALTLPWLESLASREARAQPMPPIRRFLPIFLPNGASENWKPLTAGEGAGWLLSPVMDGLAPIKSQVTVLSGLENGSVFNPDGSGSVEPSHGRQPGAWLTCVDSVAVRERLGVREANGISVDQLLAQHPTQAGRTALDSLQVGLTTVASFCDGQPCSLGRSVSWRSETEPTYKLVDPAEVFEKLVGGLPSDATDPDAMKRHAERRSVLDAVRASAELVKPKLSAHDNRRLDEFFTSVREVEQRVQLLPGSNDSSCSVSNLTPPTFTSLRNGESYATNDAVYDRRVHAQLMNDMIVLAFQCDITRVVSYMLDDEYSDFVYDFVPVRQFSPTSSIETDRRCGTYSGAQHGSQDEYASITRWNVQCAASLCERLANIVEDNGRSILDNSVVFLGSCMHGSNHACRDLPSLFVGSGGGLLKTDRHLDLGARPLRDFYFTLMNGVYGMGVSDFGVDRTGAPLTMISELLA